MRVLTSVLMLGLVGLPAAYAQSSDTPSLASYMKSLPNLKPPAYDEVERLALAANPLGCEDHPHAPSPGGSGGGRQQYLWQREGKPQIMQDYERNHAFYGCLDWHSGVNSMWMMVSL